MVLLHSRVQHLTIHGEEGRACRCQGAKGSAQVTPIHKSLALLVDFRHGGFHGLRQLQQLRVRQNEAPPLSLASAPRKPEQQNGATRTPADRGRVR
jgi:hypothetical protein